MIDLIFSLFCIFDIHIQVTFKNDFLDGTSKLLLRQATTNPSSSNVYPFTNGTPATYLCTFCTPAADLCTSCTPDEGMEPVTMKPQQTNNADGHEGGQGARGQGGGGRGQDGGGDYMGIVQTFIALGKIFSFLFF